MHVRTLAAAAALLLPLSCGSQDTEPGADATAVGAAPPDFNGTFQVSGKTVEQATGASRDISGKVVFSQEGDGYTASFELETLFPTPDGPTQAQVVGTGEGTLAGGQLEGTAKTQIILAQVPGVDAEFAFLPRQYGPRITSKSVTRINDDGSLTIEIESQGAEGESYRTTRTTVSGMRIDGS